MRVLVTGGSGFIGRNLLDRVPPDWDAVAVARGPLDVASVVRPVQMPGPDDELPSDLAREFDVVLHLAGNANHVLADTRPWDDLQATGGSAALVLGRVPARRIVLLSSAAVYAGLSGLVDPARCLRPRMAYALSKLYVEGLIDSLVAGGRVASAIVFRLYNAFGPGERQTRLIPRVRAAASNGEAFTLTGNPDSLSDPVHVDYVVTALLAAAQSSAVGTLDLCGGDPVPLQQQVGRIAEALDLRPPRIVAVPRQGEQPIRFFSDPQPLQSALRIPPPESFPAAVGRYAASSGWTHSLPDPRG